MCISRITLVAVSTEMCEIIVSKVPLTVIATISKSYRAETLAGRPDALPEFWFKRSFNKRQRGIENHPPLTQSAVRRLRGGGHKRGYIRKIENTALFCYDNEVHFLTLSIVIIVLLPVSPVNFAAKYELHLCAPSELSAVWNNRRDCAVFANMASTRAVPLCSFPAKIA